jgi:hypothetical protein
MQRPRFQDGRLLRTSDFVDEQDYHVSGHRRHNISGHVWGIANGLDVVLLEGQPVVTPGVGIDGYGRDVVLSDVRPLDLRSYRVRGIESVDVWIAYDRREVPSSGDCVDSFVDDASIELTDAADIDPRRPPGVQVGDLGPSNLRPTPDDPARRWPLYLARVRLDLSDPAKAPEIESDRRPWIGLVGATVETRDGFTWLELSGGSTPSVSVALPGGQAGKPPLRVGTGGVDLNDRLTVDGELVLGGGSLVLDPAAPSLVAPAPVAQEWSLSHVQAPVAHELRLTMPAAGTGAVPHRLVVGAWKDGDFVTSLTVDESGTVVIAGNLIVTGRLQASSVQEAQLSDAGRGYLAGLRTTSLVSLFDVAGSVVI